MDIGPAALQALIAAAVMAGLYVAIMGWAWRHFIALWLPLSILVFIIIHGPIKVG